MTAWSALFIFGNMTFKQRDGLRVLILGASGGVGTHAVQILKSQNSVVSISRILSSILINFFIHVPIWVRPLITHNSSKHKK